MTQQAPIYEGGLYMKRVTYSLQSRAEKYPWFYPDFSLAWWTE